MAVVSKNNVIAKVLSLVEDKIQGDSVLTLDQHMTNALKTVCKFVAETKPVGHEKLLFEQQTSTIYSTEFSGMDDYGEIDDNFKYFLLSDLAYPFVNTNSFHRFTFISDIVYKGYPVNSKSALALGNSHKVVYYYNEFPRVFVGSTDLVINSFDGVKIMHYIYAPITMFPEELEDLLVAELVRIIQNETTKEHNEKLEQ